MKEKIIGDPQIQDRSKWKEDICDRNIMVKVTCEKAVLDV